MFGRRGHKRIQISDVNGPVNIDADLKAGPGQATVYGSSAHDTLRAGSGNDLLVSHGSADLLVGGGGTTRLLGSDFNHGRDTIVGGSGTNLISDARGADSVMPGAHNVYENAFEPMSVKTPAAAKPAAVPAAGVFNPTVVGYTPTLVRNAYGFGPLDQGIFTNRGAGQTVAIVDAFNSATVQADLATFSTTFGLPAPTPDTFQKVFAAGTQPTDDAGWATEIALDTQWVHAIAPEAKIILVEAASNFPDDLNAAIDVATNLLKASPAGGGVVSMSFGAPENPTEVTQDSHFTQPNSASVSYVASAGDTAGEADYPALSPYVTDVGGTTLALNKKGNRQRANPESAWSTNAVNGSGTGGGISGFEPTPPYQSGLSIFNVPNTPPVPRRAGPDVAFLADPATGVAIFDTTPDPASGNTGWEQIGGTSLSAPMFAATVALSNQVRAENALPTIGDNLNNAIYQMNQQHPGEDFRDITTGKAGNNLAGPGFDLTTGWGTPVAPAFIGRLASTAVAGFPPPFFLNDDVHWSGVYYDDFSQPLLGGSATASFLGTGFAFGDTAISLSLGPGPNPTVDSFDGSINGITCFGLTRTGNTFIGYGTASVTGPASVGFSPLVFVGTVGPDANGFGRIDGHFYSVAYLIPGTNGPVIVGPRLGRGTPGDFEGEFHN